MRILPTIPGAALLFALAAGAQDAPKAPPSLSFSHGPLDVVTIHYNDGSARSFYYMTFTVRNGGSEPAELALHIEAKVTSNRRENKHVALPSPDAEEYVRRVSRSTGLKNVQEINRHQAENGRGKLEPGQELQGIAVFGTFDRGWDTAVVTVKGLEPAVCCAQIRKYGDGFTVPHRAYADHNRRVRESAGDDTGESVYALVRHDVVWRMVYSRRGDEFAPQLDPIVLVREEWALASEPEIVLEKGVPFGS